MESIPAIKPLTEITLRSRLREETATIHQSLHRNTGLQKLTSDDCSPADYVNVLTLFLHFYREVDDLFGFIPAGQRFIHEATPLFWLKKDFNSLNHPLPERSAFLVTDIVDNPFPARFEVYIGYLYVKQGSTLGGQTISKHLKKSLALTPGINQFFFTGFGEQTGNYWKEFLNYLAQHEASLDEDLVITSAQFYFDILDQLSSRYFPLET